LVNIPEENSYYFRQMIAKVH